MSNYNRDGRKRLSVDIPKDLYLDIRMSSGNKNCTVTKWIIRAITKQLKDEMARGEGTPRHKCAS